MKRCEISTCQLQILTVGKVASFHTSLQIKLISGVGVHRCVQINEWNSSGAWAPSQYPKRRLFVRSRKVMKPRDWYFKLSYRFEIWQAHRQHCCRSACQISKRSDNSKYKSRGFETWRDLTERRLFGYWDGALIVTKAKYKPASEMFGNIRETKYPQLIMLTSNRIIVHNPQSCIL